MSETEEAHIKKTPYSSAVGSLMYVIICTSTQYSPYSESYEGKDVRLVGYLDVDLRSNDYDG